MATEHFTPGTRYARNRDEILAERKEKYWARRKRKYQHCVVCGAPLPVTARTDAKYCRTLCRSRSRGSEAKAAYWRAYYAQKGKQLRANNNRRRFAQRLRPQPRPCRQCGAVFTPKIDRGLFCSRSCCYRALNLRNRDRENLRRRRKSARRRDQITSRACDWCGRLFKPLRRSCARWCSGRCLSARWAKIHPDVARAGKLKRRARLRGVAVEHISPLAIFKRDRWICQLCHQPTPQRLIGTRSPRRPTIDHILPISKGGAHTHRNVQCACSDCNSRKSARIKGQFRLF